MFLQAHTQSLGSSLWHHSVEPSGSVAWLTEGSLYCPGSSLYPVSWSLLQNFPSSVDSTQPNPENKPLPVSIRYRSQQREKQSVLRRRISKGKTYLHTHMSTVASLKTAGDSTAGCPAVEGCVRQWAEQSQTGVRRTGSFLLQYEWLSGVPCQMKEARPRRSPKTYVKRLQ